MSGDDPTPLSPDLRALLDDERDPPGMPTAARDRLRGRLGTALNAPSVDSHRANQPASTVETAPARGIVRSLASHPFRLAAATFVLGGSVGAGAHAILTKPTNVIEAASAPQREPATISPAAMLPDVTVLQHVAASTPDVVQVPVAVTPVASTHHDPIAAHIETPALEIDADHDLAAERASLEIARTALSRNQATAAIAALERHARQFPNGRLTEHREALWVQALVTAGRGDEARQRAERFQARFPQSIFIPAVEASLRSLQ